MIEIFIDAPMELQVLLLGGLIAIVWSMFKDNNRRNDDWYRSTKN